MRAPPTFLPCGLGMPLPPPHPRLLPPERYRQDGSARPPRHCGGSFPQFVVAAAAASNDGGGSSGDGGGSWGQLRGLTFEFSVEKKTSDLYFV
ncbi:hypothetical protein E2C01_060355 [Portunus trituberculatus]|uniref:Uncharacterized protein n=1 Tax=Portunus trituberculatus TaxID=210409 RepID=A0A5B7H8M8_PORTR|nr:hypothetical protein [Portunus trituberculatus]